MLDFNYEATVALRIILSVVLGFVLGKERSNRGAAAGVKTHSLVCLGSTLVMVCSEYLYFYYGMGDIARMPAQVISGIGFLGAGTIIVTGHNQIKGLTTAASIWFCACVGLGIGANFYLGTLIAVACEMVIVYILSRNISNRPMESVELLIEYNSEFEIVEFVKLITSQKCKIIKINYNDLEKIQPWEKDAYFAIVSLDIPEELNLYQFIRKQSIKGLINVCEY